MRPEANVQFNTTLFYLLSLMRAAASLSNSYCCSELWARAQMMLSSTSSGFIWNLYREKDRDIYVYGVDQHYKKVVGRVKLVSTSQQWPPTFADEMYLHY